MPDIYDPERGLKIGLTDEDYEDYQNGNLSDDFYARRTDGSIANRVTISPLDDVNDEDGERSGGIDAGSAAIGALIMATVVILHGHFRIFQRIVRQESRNLLKAEAIAIMIGYLAIPLNGNDVADAHGRMAVVGRVFIIKAVFEIVQHTTFQVAGSK